MRIVSGLLLAAALVCPLPVLAESIAYDTASIEIAVPANWKSSRDAATVTIEAPDKAMSVVFRALPSKNQDKAIAEVEEALDKAVGKVKWNEKPAKEKWGGMEAEVWNGTAKDGKLQVEATYLESTPDQTVGIYWFDTPESEEKYKADIDFIVKGIKPLTKK